MINWLSSIYFLCALLISCGNKELKLNELKNNESSVQEYLTENANELQKKVCFDSVCYISRFVPYSVQSLLTLENDSLSKEDLNAIKNTLNFVVKVELNEKVKNNEEIRNSFLEYYSKKGEVDFVLIVARDTLHPSLLHVEPPVFKQLSYTINICFDKSAFKDDDFCLVHFDKKLNNGIVKFNYKKELLSNQIKIN
jgi:hypothetical protein